MEGVRVCDIIHVLIILLQELRHYSRCAWSRRSVADEDSQPMSGPGRRAAAGGSSIFSTHGGIAAGGPVGRKRAGPADH